MDIKFSTFAREKSFQTAVISNVNTAKLLF